MRVLRRLHLSSHLLSPFPLPRTNEVTNAYVPSRFCRRNATLCSSPHPGQNLQITFAQLWFRRSYIATCLITYGVRNALCRRVIGSTRAERALGLSARLSVFHYCCRCLFCVGGIADRFFDKQKKLSNASFEVFGASHADWPSFSQHTA